MKLLLLFLFVNAKECEPRTLVKIDGGYVHCEMLGYYKSHKQNGRHDLAEKLRYTVKKKWRK